MRSKGYHPNIKQMDSKNNKIDQLLKARFDGLKAFSESTDKLIEMGVKIIKADTGDILLPAQYSKYKHDYEYSLLEFEWQVEYKNGEKLNQFEFLDKDKKDGGQHHLGHIDQDQIKTISFISNFTWPTDNEEKRIIVKLDWETGLFEFMNGFISQDDKSKLCLNPVEGKKKLILFKRARNTSAPTILQSKYVELPTNGNELFYYNRFVLGYECGKEKRMVMIYPDGSIKLFNN